MRKIVVLPTHEWLMESFAQKQAGMAVAELNSNYKTDGVTFREEDYPVRVPVAAPEGFVSVEAVPDGYKGTLGQSYVVTADFESDSATEEFLRANEDVEGVFRDPEIGVFPVVCPTNPVGTHQDVENALNLSNLTAAGATGGGVKIAIVDTGVDGTQVNVAGGWTPRPGSAPGTAPADHGTMVAFDTQIAAPNSMIFDYALLQSSGGTWVAFLSDAIRAFSEIMITHLQTPGPMVAVNSWGMYNTSSDAPIGDPQNYASNPSHPFNQITSALVGSGVDVVFAAGNCGATCPSNRCGLTDRGPGNSIHGANSHADVVSCAAVTHQDDLLGYSSEGPGKLAAQKPDISGFSHFDAPINPSFHNGTSAACPVVAGVLAAARSAPNGRDLPPATLKRHLLSNARSVHGVGWSPQFGWGIVDASGFFDSLP